MANTLLYQLSDYIGYDILMQYLQELIQQARIMLGSSNYPEPAIEQLHNSLNQASQNIAVLQSRVQINQSALMVVDRQMSLYAPATLQSPAGTLSIQLQIRGRGFLMDAIYVTTGGACFGTPSMPWRHSPCPVTGRPCSTWPRCSPLPWPLSPTLRTHDLTTMLKWVVAFVMVSGVLLGVKRPVQVIDISDPAGVYQVDNVPVGLVLPASLISTIRPRRGRRL